MNIAGFSCCSRCFSLSLQFCVCNTITSPYFNLPASSPQEFCLRGTVLIELPWHLHKKKVNKLNSGNWVLEPGFKADTHEGFCSRGTLREQSSSVCTNDFMGILHPREQNFHPAKCSTIFNRLNTWEQAPGANNAPSCVLTRAK